MQNCFTYLIGWKELDLWYYGVRYGKNVEPKSLWDTYFTSSKHVFKVREEYGEPDIREIRKTFGKNSKKAKVWEEKVLRRLNVCKNRKWLNISNINSFRGVEKSWNEGLTKENNETLKLISQKISKSKLGIPMSDSGKKILKIKRSTPESRKNNIWSQFKNKDRFKNFEELERKILSLKDECWNIPCIIAKRLAVSEYTVISLFKLNSLPFIKNQKITKVFKNYHNKFKSYEEYTYSIEKLTKEGKSVYEIAEVLDVNVCGILTFLKGISSLSPIITKRKPGPKEGSTNLGMKKNTHIWIKNDTSSVRHPVDLEIPTGWLRGRLRRLE
jgi:hypothetical protein